MLCIHTVKLKSLMAKMTVAHNRIRCKLFTVILNYFLLLFRSIRFKFSESTVNRMLRCKSRISLRLRSVKRYSAEIGFLEIVLKLNKFNSHLFKQLSYGLLFINSVLCSPTILNCHLHSAVIGINKFII